MREWTKILKELAENENKTTPIILLFPKASRANIIIKKYIMKVIKNSELKSSISPVRSKKLTINRKNIVTIKAFL